MFFEENKTSFHLLSSQNSVKVLEVFLQLYEDKQTLLKTALKIDQLFASKTSKWNCYGLNMGEMMSINCQ